MKKSDSDAKLKSDLAYLAARIAGFRPEEGAPKPKVKKPAEPKVKKRAARKLNARTRLPCRCAICAAHARARAGKSG